jgi:hypothetical protein
VAGRGPAPKSERSRPNDTARRQAEFTKVSEDGVVRGPDLPDFDWHARTVEWYATWQRSPMAQTFIAADWDFLIDTAMLHTEMWNGNPGLAAEIRLRVGKLAGTPEDRLRLRMQVETEAKQAAAPRAMSDDRRARLVAIAND